MKKILLGIVIYFILIIGLFANPLSKALEPGEWIIKEETGLSTVWVKDDVEFEWYNKKDYHYVKLADNESTIIVDDYGNPDYAKIANIKWCIIDKNRDPNVEWLEVKDSKLTGRKLKKASPIKSSNVASATKTTRAAVTAASRASEAKEDYVWEE